jgi:CubicO group peptidase (beta-lactamase class C family)
MKTIKIMIPLLIVFSLLISCTAAQPANVQEPASIQPVRAPTEWRTSAPGDQGMDGERLEEMIAYIKERHMPVHSILILRDGHLVHETYLSTYSAESLYDVFSITKSVISILIGLAIEDGLITDVHVPIAEYLPPGTIPEDDPRKGDITIEHLLTMTSGLGWLEERKYFNELYAQNDWAAYMLGLPLEEAPGEAFYYCSGCTHLLAVVLESATPDSMLDYANQRLFEPLEIFNYTWETDPNDLPIGGWGIKMQARDMAKLGQLVLQGGMWEGEQLVPEEWVRKSTSVQVRSGGELDYGYLWWIQPRFNAYAALGLGGQTIMVISEHDMVIVFTSNQGPPVPHLIEHFILPAVDKEN